MTEKSKRMGKNMRLIVDAMTAGKPLNRFFEGGVSVFVVEGMGEVKRDSVERLISAGIIKENTDAMFGVGQSFSLSQGA